MTKRLSSSILWSTVAIAAAGLLVLPLRWGLQIWCVAALHHGSDRDASLAAEVAPWVFTNDGVSRLLEPMRGIAPRDLLLVFPRESLGVSRLSDVVLHLGPRARPALESSLKDDDACLRRRGAWLLAGVSQGSSSALDALTRLLDDPSPDVRLEVLRILSIPPRKLGCIVSRYPYPLFKDTRRALGAMIRCLEDGDPRVRAEAASALAVLGEYARAAIPSLVQRVQDDDADVALRSYLALSQIPESMPPPAREALVRHLAYPDSRVEHEEAGALSPINAPCPASMQEEQQPWWIDASLTPEKRDAVGHVGRPDSSRATGTASAR